MENYNRYLYFSVFITGAAVLIIEVAAVRMLSPYYGSSLYVFSSVLTIILSALSIGYWVGGMRADKKHSVDELFKIITLSGLTVLALELVALIILPKVGVDLGAKFGPLILSMGLFFIPAFLLGIVSPYIIKIQSLTTKSEKIGSVVGKTFFWGTTGSIAGSLLTGYWLIPTFGVQKSVLAVAFALIILGVVMPILLRRPLNKKWILVVLLISVSLTFAVKSYAKNSNAGYLYLGEGLYSSIKIHDSVLNNRIIRILNRDTNNSSAIFLSGDELVFDYTKFVEFYSHLKPDSKNFLMLGGGAYTVPRRLSKLDPNLDMDVVEIEPVLYELAQIYFDFKPTENIKNYSMDARIFLNQTDKKYDVIFADTFGTDLAAPFHLTTFEFYKLAQSHMTENSLLIINYIGTPNGPRPSLTGSLIKTITTVFPNTKAYALNPEEKTEVQNIIFISRNGEQKINLEDQVLYSTYQTDRKISDLEIDLSVYDLEEEYLMTDDHAPVEKLMAKQR
jgi:predicted membrane-bound spermidine synthase